MEGYLISDVLQAALTTAFLVTAPMLFTGMAVGVVISILQAATQINEVTLVFIPKMFFVGLVIWMTGGWMYEQLLILVALISQTIDQISQGGI